MTQPTLQVTLPAPNVPSGYRLTDPPQYRAPKKGEWVITFRGGAYQTSYDYHQCEHRWIVEPSPAPEPVRKVTVYLATDSLVRGESGSFANTQYERYKTPVTFLITGQSVELAAAADARELREQVERLKKFEGGWDAATVKAQVEDFNELGRTIYFLREQVERLTREREEARWQYQRHLDGCAAERAELIAIGLHDSSGDEGAGVWVNVRADAVESRLATLEGVVREEVSKIDDIAKHFDSMGAAVAMLQIASRLTAAVEPVQPAPPRCPRCHAYYNAAAPACPKCNPAEPEQPPARLSPDEEESAYWEGRDALEGVVKNEVNVIRHEARHFRNMGQEAQATVFDRIASRLVAGLKTAWTCPNCDQLNESGASKCERCDDERPILTAAVEPVQDAKQKPAILETLDAIHAAGGSAWDNVADPDAAIREMRGEPVQPAPAAKPDEAVRRVVEAAQHVVSLCVANKFVIAGDAKGDPSYWTSLKGWIDKFNAAVDAMTAGEGRE